MVDAGRASWPDAGPVWVAGGPAGRTDEARAAGAALNVWDADPALVAERVAGRRGVEVTWAGRRPRRAALAETVRASGRGGRHLGRSSAGPSTWTRWPAAARAASARAVGPGPRGRGP